MKSLMWSGCLPRYWVESPWWVPSGEHAILLVPCEDNRVLSCRNTAGEIVWERTVVQNLLLLCEDQVVVTARIRDGRSHAVLSQFAAYDATSGRLLWALPAELAVYLPKGGIPVLPIDRVTSAVRIDVWRRLTDGSQIVQPPSAEQNSRGDRTFGATVISETPAGLSFLSDAGNWVAHDLELRNVLGVRSNFVVGVEPEGGLWVRDATTGSLLWNLAFEEHNVVVPSVRVGGLAFECWPYAETVPVAAVMTDEAMYYVENSGHRNALRTVPSSAELETWNNQSTLVLLGPLGEGLLVLGETKDGMGSLWFVDSIIRKTAGQRLASP